MTIDLNATVEDLNAEIYREEKLMSLGPLDWAWDVT